MERALGRRESERARLLARNWPRSVWLQRLSTQSRSACWLGSRREGGVAEILASFFWATAGYIRQKKRSSEARENANIRQAFMVKEFKSRRGRELFSQLD